MSTRLRTRIKGSFGHSDGGADGTALAIDAPEVGRLVEENGWVYELPYDPSQTVEDRILVYEGPGASTVADGSTTGQSGMDIPAIDRERGDERHDDGNGSGFVPQDAVEGKVGDALNIYKAVPLSEPSSFRLLEIVPGVLGMISCKLYTADLRDSPAYTAISYTWGSPYIVKTIMVNGELFEVRENLWNFLSEARTGRHHSLGPLWIDAICIEQASVPERNHQVSVMGEIYVKAAKVVSWLGPDTPRLSTAILWLKDPAVRLPIVGMEPHEPLGTVNALRDLCDHAYWTRLWIIQEVVLAREVQVWCGGHQFPLHLLYAATKNRPSLWRRITYRRLGEMTTPANRVLERRYHPRAASGSKLSIGEGATEADKMKASSDDDNDLCSLLKVTCLAECEDPRDGIFGILSILASDEKQLLDIQPDYSKDREAIVLDVVDKIWIHLAKCDTRDYHRYMYWIFKALRLPQVHVFYQLYSPATAIGQDRKKYYDMWRLKQAEESIETREKVDLSLMEASIDLE